MWPSKLHLTFHQPPRQLPPFDRQRLLMVSRPDRFCLNLETGRETHSLLSSWRQTPKSEKGQKEPRTMYSHLKRVKPVNRTQIMASLTYRAAPEQRYPHSRETTGWSYGSGAPDAAKEPPRCWPARIWNSDVVSRERRAQIHRMKSWVQVCLPAWPLHPCLPPSRNTAPSRCCLPVCHWSQSLRNQGQSLDETWGSDLPKSTRRKGMVWSF